MDFLQDWKFWSFTIQLVVTIAGFLVIKFNDFRHLGYDVKDIKNRLDKQSEKLNNINTRTAILEERTKDLTKGDK